MLPNVISKLPGYYAHGKEIPLKTKVYTSEVYTKNGDLLVYYDNDNQEWVTIGDGNCSIRLFNADLEINKMVVLDVGSCDMPEYCVVNDEYPCQLETRTF